MRIFLDANVIFSAAKSKGAVRLLLAMLRRAGHECWADPYVVEEARRNLTLKLPDGPAFLDSEHRHLHVVPRHSVDSSLAAALPLGEKDRPVLAAAIRLRCAALLTGDRTHFGPLFGKTLQGVTIHSPRSAGGACSLPVGLFGELMIRVAAMLTAAGAARGVYYCLPPRKYASSHIRHLI